ncbi:3-mercaptopyruvate sulfurtransferase [Arsenophonus nasoniae]|uniref:Sulfurtransferase n=1 Tax=Arsenophonus nasoniae TaxID=638 RepID=D2TYB1_9GAMM|nr:3-mercaptopyruvate sulfurtransferase [Arsenophonus nasoniae]QBY43014.1 3-mercaptopyruvate sulfurtransferase [Arsenophonus nasoniae]WGM07053.1 3-mercaptopyruvate sulfurtransferase [Arsenophonus nasoniae]WGM11933.1 3-mercaptopyruvate sulfurtransferase [Arsenophonus nasoniae]WGM16618.1 3-mercaptopyruvate sulfurtransferase [Arsenophonus nasoniae]CBA72393.1 3-mercaptopyruvate sulfurtransferase [Arsenophonus nasoniae]
MYEAFFVNPQWLHQHLTNENIILVNASAPPPTDPTDYQQRYYQEHIPGAQFFNLDIVADQSNNLPHMLPDEITFTHAVEQLGISNHHQVVIYDQGALFSAPRAWWTFKTFGCNNVKILTGGLHGWKKAGYLLDSGMPTVRQRQHFAAKCIPDQALSQQQVLALLQQTNVQFIDARPTARFNALQPEPRLGLRMGHLPGSKNVPWDWLVNEGCYKSPEALKTIFANQQVDITLPTVISCGSGMTAAVVLLALIILGNKNVKLYDGSWAEWGQDNGLPIETK